MQKKSELIPGIIKRNPDGFGFFIPEDREIKDIYIGKQQMFGAMSGDEVLVEYWDEPNGDRLRGAIKEILTRNFTEVFGKPYLLDNGEYCIPDHSHAWGSDLIFSTDKEIGEDDWVYISITSYPEKKKNLSGDVIKVVDGTNSLLLDSLRILSLHSIPYDFPKEVIAEAEQYPPEVRESDLANREDLRNLPLITIDGATAKDFDDAICVQNKTDGFLLHVAIADVSHYVKKNSNLDKEAVKRGNSTYFPSFVSPMLPEALSNELCSLKPKVDRLALVAEIHLDFSGKTTSSKFYEAVICSHARLTYGLAQEIIDGDCPGEFEDVKEVVLKACDLSKILMKNRFSNGALDLDIPEIIVELDQAGKPLDIVKGTRIYSHKLIEELMLLANVEVSKFLHKKETPQMYRIHDKPKQDNVDKLEKYLSTLSYGGKMGESGLQKKLSKVLKWAKDQPQYQVLSQLTLRTMNQAKYSPENIRHFGLNFDFYCHFTSPIRRYADLLIHRALKHVVAKNYKKEATLDDFELSTLGTMLSASEQRSVKAEREIESIKKTQFMEQFVGHEFEGEITSVTKFGIFVTLKKFPVDGLIKMERLGGDFFIFNEEQFTLVGKRSGFTYKLGDKIFIKVANANTELGQLDFSLTKRGQILAQLDAGADPQESEEFRRPSRRKSFKDSRDSKDGESRGKGSRGKKRRSGTKRSDSKKNANSDSKKTSSGKNRSSKKGKKQRSKGK